MPKTGCNSECPQTRVVYAPSNISHFSCDVIKPFGERITTSCPPLGCSKVLITSPLGDESSLLLRFWGKGNQTVAVPGVEDRFQHSLGYGASQVPRIWSVVGFPFRHRIQGLEVHYQSNVSILLWCCQQTALPCDGSPRFDFLHDAEVAVLINLPLCLFLPIMGDRDWSVYCNWFGPFHSSNVSGPVRHGII